jgi:uncharacterized protein YbjT (DUF2867 family)
MIAVDDIGWFGARTFTDAAALNRREIDLAGDVRTMPEAAEILTEALERPITFAQTPIEQVRQFSKDMALMLEWFERVGYSADIAGLERGFGRGAVAKGLAELEKSANVMIEDLLWWTAALKAA